MKIVPLNANVVVKRLPAEETTAGGIVLPDGAQEKPRQGRVLSVGDGRRLPDGSHAEPQVGEGDRVGREGRVVGLVGAVLLTDRRRGGQALAQERAQRLDQGGIGSGSLELGISGHGCAPFRAATIA